MGIWHLFVMRNHSVFIVRGSLLRWYSVWPLFHTCGETSFIELPWRNKAVILWIFNRCQHGNKLSMCQRKDAPCFLVAYGTLGVLWVSWRRWSSASRRGTSEEGITFVCSWYCARLLSCSTEHSGSFFAVLSFMGGMNHDLGLVLNVAFSNRI